MIPITLHGETHSAAAFTLSTQNRLLCPTVMPLTTILVGAKLIADDITVHSAGSMTAEFIEFSNGINAVTDKEVTLTSGSATNVVNLVPAGYEGGILGGESVFGVRFKGLSHSNSVTNPRLCIVAKIDPETIRSIEMA